MQHAFPHTHLPHLPVDLHRFGRDALVVAALGLSSTVATASERVLSAPGQSFGSPAAQESGDQRGGRLSVVVRVEALGASANVRGLDPSAVNTVSLINDQGEAVIPRATTQAALLFEDVPIGRYRIVASSEGPTMRDGQSAISSSIVVRSDPFSLHTRSSIVVETR